jgi:hypothetical protein
MHILTSSGKKPRRKGPPQRAFSPDAFRLANSLNEEAENQVKMILKEFHRFFNFLKTVVNFANILRVAFLYKSVACSCFVLTF